MKATEQAYNNNTLKYLNEIKYANVLDEDHIIGEEISIRLNEENTIEGFAMKLGRKKYFLQTEHTKKLPLKVTNETKIIHRSEVYYLITGANTINLKPSNKLSFKDLIDNFCNFEHTNPTHFLLWKIICVTAYLSRVNFRLATNAGFGKDSVIDAIRDLTRNASRIDNATFAKLEYVLRFPFIVCNEVASLKPEEKKEFESFGLSCGAFQNTYVKRSRKVRGTKEMYDISNLSLGFTYNYASYYRDVGKKSFDEVFPEQFLDRFLPLKMEGRLEVGKFKKMGELDFVKECEKNMEVYGAILQKINYLLLNPPTSKYKIPFYFGKFGRHERSFSTISLYLEQYAKDKVEWSVLIAELWNCYNNYLNEEGKRAKPVVDKSGKLIVEEEEM